ncbi:hypothetical protein X777_13809 [Ooceraea biroi]|uniref:Uncharacterized protein n=1 Tax=Ooceraea biroi TaxID=2015173 RepID=A0A026VZW1_OOCBI|nr:hypothetical protein X777_13809 [Ooceraea biroi]
MKQIRWKHFDKVDYSQPFRSHRSDIAARLFYQFYSFTYSPAREALKDRLPPTSKLDLP